MSAGPSATPRDPGAGWGVAVLLAWLLLVASGFWNLVAVPMREAAAAALDPAQAVVVERWAAEAAGPRARASMVLFDPGACACGADARESLLRRFRERGVTTRPVAADLARLPLRPEVLVIDAHGRLRYAGPAAPTAFCSGPRHAAERALSMPTHAPALVLPADCPCNVG